MQINSRVDYLIPLFIFIIAYPLYSINLANQPWQSDEPVYLAWGGTTFDLIKNGNLDNPCLISLQNCDSLHYDSAEVNYSAEVTYSTVRNFLVGFGQYLSSGDNQGDFYQWSCFSLKCWENGNLPSTEQFAAGRFFSSLLGSLTVVLVYFIGKIFFNKYIGLTFSLVLFFHGLWFWNSRVIMSEVYSNFFIILSILLLLFALKANNKSKIIYFILGAIVFGLAVNVKLTAVELSILFVGMILFMDYFRQKLSFSFLRKKKHTLRLISFVLIFLTISSISFIVFSPKYYDDPLLQTSETLKQGDFGFISFPSIHNDNIFRTLATYHTTLIPYSFDYYDLNYKEIPTYSLSNTVPFTYTSVPLTLFFFVGIGYLLNSIYRKKLIFSEFILLIWFSSLFILTILTVESFWVERFYVPLFFPILFIASYGIYLFIKKIKTKKIQISFFVFFIFCHIVTTLSFWNVLYQSPDERWGNPLTEMNLQTAFENPVVIISSLLFVIWYIFFVNNLDFIRKFF